MPRVAPAIKRLLERPEAERRLGPLVLLKQLGRGGFAPVWLAREVYGATELRAAAVKLFSLDAGRQRILEEARALCRVEHPNVVRFHNLHFDEKSEVMGLAMEHVRGTPLDERLAAQGRLSVLETLAIGTALGRALAAVHGAGLVHRDVKPANVIESGGVYKLIDFGIAAADTPDERWGLRPQTPASGDGAPLTEARELPDLPPHAVGTSVSSLGGLVSTAGQTTADGAPITAPLAIPCGTIGYIDPASIAHGAKASPASDLYALGAMLYECLTGKVPAAASAPAGAGLRGEVLDGRATPPKLADLAPEAPPALARLIDALLAPDRRARPASAERVARALEQIKDERAGRGGELPAEEVGPFRGLARFKAGDRSVYFGRGSEIAAALETLRSRGVVALVGPSGSGKSSLARAGVLPAIAEGALGGFPQRWDTAILSPGADPRAAVAAALEPFIPPCQRDDMAPESLVAALAERAEEAGRGLVVLIDQLEELCTIAAPEGRAWMVELLARLGEQAIPGVRVVAAVRRDLLDPLLGLGPLGKALMRGSVLIEPITSVVWGDVLDQALSAYGYTFEDDALREELLAELSGTVTAMPLVQFALTELWNKRDPVAKKVTRKGLREIGGLAGALERHAEATLGELTLAHEGAASAARQVLLSLTTPQGTRTSRSLAELSADAGPGAEEAIVAFERARLIISSASGVTLAHEALLSQWDRLRRWVEEAREDRQLADELEQDARRFRLDPDAVPRWQKHHLACGEELLSRRSVALSEDAIAFLKASRRAARRSQVLGGLAAAAVLFSLAGGALAYIRVVKAEEAATRRVLVEKQANLERTERDKLELTKQREKIDQLVGALSRAPTEEEVLTLQKQVRAMQGAEAAQPAQASSPGKEKPRVAAAAPKAPAQAPPPAQDAPAPAAAKTTSEVTSTALAPSQQW